jgi:ABC-type uncharacterized transport system substrate-binding protein
MIEYDDRDQIPGFLLRSSHSERKFIEGRAPLASFDGCGSRSRPDHPRLNLARPSILQAVLSFRFKAREALAVKRRDFIALIGGVAAAWPLAARAQQPPKTIGFLGTSTRSAESEWIAAFVERLRELGWIDGRTVAIEYQWAEGRDERFAEIAAEFVRRKVDVIVTWGTAPTIAAKQATPVIPVVAAAMGDPLGTGIVASLARPGGNVTGLSALVTDLASKRLELLREVVPSLRRLAIMYNVDAPAALLDMKEVQTAAGTLGFEVTTSEIRQLKDIAPAFDAFKGHADALYICTDPLAFTNLVRINILAAATRVPTMHARREYGKREV